MESGNNNTGQAAEVGVGGDELGVADAGGGVDDGVRSAKAMVEAEVGGGQRHGLVERDHAAEQRLGREAVGQRAPAMLGEVPIDLIEDQ